MSSSATAPHTPGAAWRLALHFAQLTPGSEMKLDEGVSVVLLRDGKVIADDGDESNSHQTSEAWVQRSPARLIDGGAAASIDWWTLSRGGERTVGNDAVLLEREITIDTPTCLLRCDQVDFPPGGVAYSHTHAGPGIRRLISGTLRVETNGESHVYGPGDAWFEAGPATVYAAASRDVGAAFVRVLVLPVAFKGKSSINYVREEDRVRPKDQRYTIYLDEETSL